MIIYINTGETKIQQIWLSNLTDAIWTDWNGAERGFWRGPQEVLFKLQVIEDNRYYYNPFTAAFQDVGEKRGTAQYSHYVTTCSKASPLSV